MELDFTDKFKRGYKGLSKIIQRQADKKLELLANNLLHPSFSYLSGKIIAKKESFGSDLLCCQILAHWGLLN